MTARLSSPEVKKRLQQFSKRFRNAENEQREATMFWAGFYNCFGISAAEAIVFEQQVRKLDGNKGRIDSFIPGLLIVEYKSRSRDLEAAYEQAVDKAYSYKSKDDDASRVAFLFKLYEEQTSFLPSVVAKKIRVKKLKMLQRVCYE